MSYISFTSMSSCSGGFSTPFAALPGSFFNVEQQHQQSFTSVDSSGPALLHGWGASAATPLASALPVPKQQQHDDRELFEATAEQDAAARAWQMFNRMALRGGGLVCPTPAEEALLQSFMKESATGAASCSSQCNMRRQVSQQELVFQMEL
jgi:hypothetical protein